MRILLDTVSDRRARLAAWRPGFGWVGEAQLSCWHRNMLQQINAHSGFWCGWHQAAAAPQVLHKELVSSLRSGEKELFNKEAGSRLAF